MLLEMPPAFHASAFRVDMARNSWEQQGARRLRRMVFCQEQGIFATNDRDDIDAVAQTIVACSLVAGMPDEVVGTVRIHQPEHGVWFGSRLAVAPAYRGVGALGTALIRVAVCSAHQLGCTRFYAHVQSQNAAFFQRLHWRSLQQLELHGHPHHFMQADLAHYPPIDAAATIEAAARKAA